MCSIEYATSINLPDRNCCHNCWTPSPTAGKFRSAASAHRLHTLNCGYSNNFHGTKLSLCHFLKMPWTHWAALDDRRVYFRILRERLLHPPVVRYRRSSWRHPRRTERPPRLASEKKIPIVSQWARDIESISGVLCKWLTSSRHPYDGAAKSILLYFGSRGNLAILRPSGVNSFTFPCFTAPSSFSWFMAISMATGDGLSMKSNVSHSMPMAINWRICEWESDARVSEIDRWGRRASHVNSPWPRCCCAKSLASSSFASSGIHPACRFDSNIRPIPDQRVRIVATLGLGISLSLSVCPCRSSDRTRVASQHRCRSHTWCPISSTMFRQYLYWESLSGCPASMAKILPSVDFVRAERTMGRHAVTDPSDRSIWPKNVSAGRHFRFPLGPSKTSEHRGCNGTEIFN